MGWMSQVGVGNLVEYKKTSITVYISCIFWEDLSARVPLVMAVSVSCVGQERPCQQLAALLGERVLGAERLGHI